MAITLTVGTNTYISLADAETFMEGYYDESGLWAAAEDATKDILLAHATRMIDRQSWKYEKTGGDDQALEFPRYDYTTSDDEHEKVQHATVVQALSLLVNNPSQRQHLQDQGVRSMRIGDLSETYAGGVAPLCHEAMEYLAGYVRRGAAKV